jgi:hypothetical protein
MSAEGPFPVNTILAEAIDDQDYYPLSSALDPTITPTTERASFRLALGAGRHGGRFTAGNVGRHEGAVLLLLLLLLLMLLPKNAWRQSRVSPDRLFPTHG